MPRRKKIKPKLQIKSVNKTPQDLEEFIREAGEVRMMTTTPGWAILQRDLLNYRNTLVSRLAYIDPSRIEHKEMRILFIAIDKLLSLVNDYQENRDIAIELLNKLENPELAVTMDVDNE